MNSVNRFTSAEIDSFRLFEIAMDKDAEAQMKGRDTNHVLLFKKHFPKFKPVRYCQWKETQQCQTNPKAKD
jgi:hypothetical protein